MHGALWQCSLELPVSCAGSWRAVCQSTVASVQAAETVEAPSSRRWPSGRVRARRPDCPESCLRRALAPVSSSGSGEHGAGAHAWRPGAGPQRGGWGRLSLARGTPSPDIFDADHDAFTYDASHAPTVPVEGPSEAAVESSQSSSQAQVLTAEPSTRILEGSGSEALAQAAAYPDSLPDTVSQPGTVSVPHSQGPEVAGQGPEQRAREGLQTAGFGGTSGEESSRKDPSAGRVEQRRQEEAQEAAASMATLAETAVTTSLLGAALRTDDSLRTAGTADSSCSTLSQARTSPGPKAISGVTKTNAGGRSADGLSVRGNTEALSGSLGESRGGAAASSQPRPEAAVAAAKTALQEGTGAAVNDAATEGAVAAAAIEAATGGGAGPAVGSGSEAEGEGARVLTRGEFLRGVTHLEPSEPWQAPDMRETEVEAGRAPAQPRPHAEGAAAQRDPTAGLESSTLPQGVATSRGTVVLRHQAARMGWRLLEEVQNGSPDRSGQAAEPQSIPTTSGSVPGPAHPNSVAGPDESQAITPASRRAGQRLFPVRVSRGTLRRALGIPEPGEKKNHLIRARTARVREQMNAAVRTAQESAAAELISAAFFIIVPLSIGAVVYTAVGHLISQIGPAPPPPREPEAVTWWHGLSDTWHSWMMSGQAAGAAGAFAGFAGVGIAAKTAAPAAALMTSSAGELDSLWRSLGGASLVALYWKTLVFGKTFRAVEWDLLAHSAPEGPMHSVTIRVPSLNAVKTKIALASGIKDSSAIKQLALWVPGSGDFVEPLEDARDLSLVPEMGFIVWSTSPRTQVPFPHRANQRRTPAATWPAEGAGAGAGASPRADMVAYIVEAHEAGLQGPCVPPLPVEECLAHASPRPASETPVGDHYYAVGQGLPLGGEQALSPMTAAERDALVCLVAKDDGGLQVLYQAFGATEAFAHHALYYIRSNRC